MYEQFYGLREKPFALLPDAEFLYLSSRHRRALSLLDYGIAARAGFVVITGEVGTGKTTILRRFLRKTDASLTVGLVTNASAAHQGMLDWVSTAFDLAHQGRDHITLYNQFVDFLVAQYSAGKRTVLVVDEAQNLTVQMLEDLRMLSNVNNEKDALLQIVLVGQPELLQSSGITAVRAANFGPLSSPAAWCGRDCRLYPPSPECRRRGANLVR